MTATIYRFVGRNRALSADLELSVRLAEVLAPVVDECGPEVLCEVLRVVREARAKATGRSAQKEKTDHE